MNSEKNAVLIGHNFNSILGIARALGKEGWSVSTVRTRYKKKKNLLGSLGLSPEAHSKYIGSYQRADGTDTKGLIRVLEELAAGKEDKSILLPVDDLSAIFVDENLEALRENYLMPNVRGESGQVIYWMDKYRQKELAMRVGLPVPGGWSVTIAEGQYTIPDEITYPCFAKAETPVLDRKAFMKKCEDRQELKELLDKAASICDCVMLVEEFVDIEKEYGCVGVSDGVHVCIPAITEKTQLGCGSNVGVTVCGLVHEPAEYPDTWHKMREFVAATEFQGMFDIDLYERGGTVYFNEMNVRMGAEGVGTLLAGANLAVMFADIAKGKSEKVDFDAVADKITFVNERPLYSDFGEGYITRRQCRDAIRSSGERFIYSKDDKGPYYNSALFIARQYLRRLKKKVKHG